MDHTEDAKPLMIKAGEQARIEADEEVKIVDGKKWGILITLSDDYDLARLSLHSSGRFLFVESPLLKSGSECIELGDDLAINLYGFKADKFKDLQTEIDGLKEELTLAKATADAAHYALANAVDERDGLQDKLKAKGERLQYEIERADFNYGVGEEYKAQLNEAKEELRHCQILLDRARSDATNYKVDAERQEVEVAKLEAVKKALVQLIHEMR